MGRTHKQWRTFRQLDFFVADILDAAPKDDMASMEHPLFALKAGDKRVRVYERNGSTVTIMPGHYGCATIHDKDLWIYWGVSQKTKKIAHADFNYLPELGTETR